MGRLASGFALLGVAALLASVAACVHPPAPAQGPTCGGDSTPSRLAELHPATVVERDAVAGADGRWGALVVRVDSSLAAHPVENAAASFVGTTIGAYTDSAGMASIRAPAGAYTLLVRRIGYANQKTPVRLRAGYRDTVSLGLGAVPTCLVETVEVR